MTGAISRLLLAIVALNLALLVVAQGEAEQSYNSESSSTSSSTDSSDFIVDLDSWRPANNASSLSALQFVPLLGMAAVLLHYFWN